MTDESAMVRREEDEYEIDARPRQWETLACGFKLRFRLRVVRDKLHCCWPAAATDLPCLLAET